MVSSSLIGPDLTHPGLRLPTNLSRQLLDFFQVLGPAVHGCIQQHSATPIIPAMMFTSSSDPLRQVKQTFYFSLKTKFLLGPVSSV